MKSDGKVAVVTGGGQGIGCAIALTLAREGADVAIICQTHLELAREVADKVKALGRRALAIKCDVANSEEVNQATKQVLDNFKRIDILVNSAGISEVAPAADTTDATWDRVININLKGTFLCSRAVGRRMIKQKRGKIINIASKQAHVATPNASAYCASKAGVLGLTRALAVEWASYNINVNAVSPGQTDTPMTVETKKKVPDLLERVARIPLRRLNKSEEIASAVLFLASPEADNITGQSIIIDGGVTALNAEYIWPDR